MHLYNLNADRLLALAEVLQQQRAEKLCIAEANLEKASLRGLVLRDVYFAGGTFEGADLSGTQLQNVEFEGTSLCDAQLQDARLVDVSLYDVYAYGCRLNHAQLVRVSFLGSNLVLSVFDGARFQQVVFGKDNVDHPTDVAEASFSDVNLQDVTFSGVEYDPTTRFPTGFDPRRVQGLRLRTD
jgi:uncharacterized protein YjbI with pentapeptide repeats